MEHTYVLGLVLASKLCHSKFNSAVNFYLRPYFAIAVAVYTVAEVKSVRGTVKAFYAAELLK